MTTDLKKLAEVTQTPRTDALVQITEGGAQIFDRLWMLNHARTLELECTALRADREDARTTFNRLLDELRDLKAQLARHEEAAPQGKADEEDTLRLSMSGYSLKVGWGDEKRIIARSPRDLHTMKPEEQEQWFKDAERLCDGWNRNTPPPQPAPQDGETKL